MMTGLQPLIYLCLQPLLVSVLFQPPTNLRLFSQNFQHVLTWVEPNDEPFISYDVSYSKDYRRFVPAINCLNITIRRCDLTKHFTDIFSEYKPGVQSFTHKRRSNVTVYQFPLNPKVNSSYETKNFSGTLHHTDILFASQYQLLCVSGNNWNYER
ncbi:interferon alpha/beta receptor 2-like [Ranitomeya variabilis]|uniref:interferon alpha/beta receptor 2-like n=1 Tax=Ranitomeya variabilis TaxID=490064 RepID=UPI004056000A